MFGEIMKLRELRRLLKRERYEDVLERSRDPSIRDHRRAREAADSARRALLAQARRLGEQARHEEALRLVRAVVRDVDHPEGRALEQELRQAAVERARLARDAVGLRDAALRRWRAGDPEGALERLGRDPRGAEVVSDLNEQFEEGRRAVERVRRDLAAGHVVEAAVLAGSLRVSPTPAPDLDAVLWEVVDRALEGDRPTELAAVTRHLGADGRSALPAICADPLARRLIDHAARAYAAGDSQGASLALDPFPLGREMDVRAAALGQALRRLERASRVLADGDLELALALATEAEGLAGSSPLAEEIRRRVVALRSEAAPRLEAARDQLATGRLVAARETLVALLELQPRNTEAADLVAAVDRRDGDDDRDLQRARDLMAGGQFDQARKILVDLGVRRPDLPAAPGLLREAEQMRRASRMSAFGDESRLFAEHRSDRGRVHGTPGHADPQATPGPRLVAGQPYVLRVEERGDWLVHPGRDLVIGKSLGGVADLPVLAAIGRRHARIRREGSCPQTRYVLEPIGDRRVVRNRRPVDRPVVLSHGDVVELGGILTFTFLLPVPDSPAAVLRLDGDFTIHGCHRVILVPEEPEASPIVIAPGPEAHVPLPPDRDRVELVRGGEPASGDLWARAPMGVSSGDGPARPKVRVIPGTRVHTVDVDFFIDPVVG